MGKRVAELELLHEDERASYAADTNGKTTSNGHPNTNNGHEAYEVRQCLMSQIDSEASNKPFVFVGLGL